MVTKNIFVIFRDRDTTEEDKRQIAEEEEKRLLAMEARMKMRMEQEFERLKNESKMGNFTDEVNEDVVQISEVVENNEEVSDNSDINLVKQDSKEDLVDMAVSLVENAVSQAKAIVIGENKVNEANSPSSPINDVEQTLTSDPIASTEYKSTRKGTERYKKHSTVHDAEEMISKLKEIEELKRKNIESKKRKQLEEEEKLQRELELQQQNKNKSNSFCIPKVDFDCVITDGTKYSIMNEVKFSKGCLPRILLSSILEYAVPDNVPDIYVSMEGTTDR